MKEKIRQD